MNQLNLKESIRDVVLKSLKWFVISLLLLEIHGCTNAPNGAINYNTTLYWQDGEWLDSLVNVENPMDFPVKDTRDYIHIYKSPVIMHHSQMLVLYCKRDKQWEKISAYYNHRKDMYEYSVTRLPKQ